MRVLRFACLGLALVIGGCAQFNAAENAFVSASKMTVPAKQIYIAINSFDAIEITADKYIQACNKHQPLCVSRAVVTDIRKPLLDGRNARNTLKAFLRNHPGELGDQGVVDVIQAATAALTASLSS